MEKSTRILVLVPFCEQHMERIREAAGPQSSVVQCVGPHDEAALHALLDGVDVVIGEPNPAVLAKAPSVRWVQMTWAGTDLYTRNAVPFPTGMRLTNVAGSAYGHIISQYVLAQVLSIAHNLPSYIRQESQALWKGAGSVMTLEGTRALVFGAGDIGSCTACHLTHFGVECVGICRNVSQPRAGFTHLVTLDQAETMLPSSDIVVCCLPSSTETDGYLNERRLRLMKDASILVNVGRGRFVDCDALAQVLAEGRLRGAALDVTNPEPLPPAHPLWSEPRCVITPHVAGKAFGVCPDTENRICDVVCENLKRWIAEEPLTHVVI
ncbi:MAG: D-2-hydroxyacid dehydrogenase [Coriobacteriales bacterium]|nr:D-2-hydroxyacid dehydrogenase [Coriobacteriales bacterium]